MAVLLDETLWGQVATILAPPERLLPSEWAEKHRVLKPGTTPQPGRWRNDFFPWLPQIADMIALEPHKKGWLFQKHTQAGGSENAVNLVGWIVDQSPGPILYLCSTDKIARKFSLDRFGYMIESAPVLKEKFLLGKREHETLDEKFFVGGYLVIFGSQSPNKLESIPFQYVLLDEVDRLPVFPRIGSAFSLAEKRLEAFQPRAKLCGWSKPTLDDEGIAIAMEHWTDQRRFFVPCLRCGKGQWLKFGQVKMVGRQAETAYYECEHCAKAWTDGERAAAVYQGVYRSVLNEKEAARRPYGGFYIGGLYNPRKTIYSVAAEYAGCHSEAQLQVFFNGTLGEPYTRAARPVTTAAIEARAVRLPQEPVPTNTRFLTAGIDVQHRDWLYLDVSAWTLESVKHTLLYERVQGWERLEALLRGFEATDGERKLGIRGAAIDCEYLSREVYAFCKKLGASFILPCAYKTVPPELFFKRALHKYEGLFVYYLPRAFWLDRALGRFAGSEDAPGVVMAVTEQFDEYKRHILSLQRIETVDEFGKRKLTWKRDRQARDDWAHAAAYSEFAAYMLGLDTLQQRVEVERDKQRELARVRPEVGKETGGWIDRSYRKKLKGGGWIRR